VNANYPMGFGMAVGQAHLLDDVISLVCTFSLGRLPPLMPEVQLELDPDDGPSIMERMTLTYGLGENHGLYPLLTGAE